ncbi:MAG: hypothetical protein AAGK14_01495 [Verrucomicrobiota bacterium]
MAAAPTAASDDPSDHFFQPDKVAPERLNEVLGLELFTDEPFFQSKEAEVGQRVGWPEESRTDELASYRLYAGPEERLLGARPYSCVLYARDGQPMMVSVVYTNKGDFFGGSRVGGGGGVAFGRFEDFEEALQQDEELLEQALASVLGKPRRVRFGKGSMRERALRWDWRGVAFLLSAQDDEYVGLRIVSSEMADNDGVLEPLPDAEFKRKLQARVQRRDNGDVILAQIPMVDQGPKGYCVPATWERYLRYMDIPADMYVLAMAAQTQAGGGSYAGVIDESAQRLARRHKKRVEYVRGDLDLETVAEHIDQGLPLMWNCLVDPRADHAITLRSLLRRGEVPEEHVGKVEELYAELAEQPQSFGGGGGHMRLIIGYNEQTGEIAITDSWGKGFEERWMPVADAQAIHRDRLKIIEP